MASMDSEAAEPQLPPALQMLPANLDVPTRVSQCVDGVNLGVSSIEPGSFGKVCAGKRHRSGRPAAVNGPPFTSRSLIEWRSELESCRRLAAEPHRHCLGEWQWFLNKEGRDTPVTQAGTTSLMTIARSKFQGLHNDLVLSFVRQLALAVRHLHMLDIIHGDIHPASVLIVGTADGPHLQLAGASRSHPPFPVMAPGDVTQWYGAPEVIMLGQASRVVPDAYSFRSDMWSLGCVAGELVHRQVLFETCSESEMAVLAVMSARLGEPEATQIPTHIPCKSTWPPLPTGRPPIILLSKLAAAGPAALSAGADLAARCLIWDPSCRISAARCVQHCFLWLEVPASGSGDAFLSTSLLGGGAPAGARAAQSAADSAGDARQMEEAGAEVGGVAAGSIHCRCRARCNSGHGKKPCVQIARPHGLCEECSCTALSCSEPRMRGIYCFGHGYLHLPAEMQLTRVFGLAGLLPRMMPADTQAYLAAEPHIFGDWALDLLAAWFRDPLAITLLAANKPTGNKYSVAEFERTLLAVCGP